VQQLAVAKYALSVADMERTMTAIDAALDTARRTLSDLLEVITPPQSATYGGKLLRNAPAAWDPPAQPTPDQTRPGQPTPVQPGPDRTRRDQPMPAVVAPID
jgi:hypothetical protein